MDDKITELLVEVRDNPIIGDLSGLHLAVGHLIDEVCGLLKKKNERSKKAHEGYIIWKSRCLNYAQMLMEIRLRKAAADCE